MSFISYAQDEMDCSRGTTLYEVATANHISKISLDDSLSKKIFDNFITSLDPTKLVFSIEDISSFQKDKFNLDDDIRIGSCQSFLNITERYIANVDRINKIISTIRPEDLVIHQISEEGLEKIKNSEPYNGDTKLKFMANKFLKFYKESAEEHYPVFTNFYLKQEDFEKQVKNFESVKPRKRTKKMVDAYNRGVNEYNSKLSEYNSTQELLNKKSTKLFDDWEKTVENFFNKHVD